MDKKAETENSIEWFESLRDEIIKGNTEDALKAIQAAIDLLERNLAK